MLKCSTLALVFILAFYYSVEAKSVSEREVTLEGKSHVRAVREEQLEVEERKSATNEAAEADGTQSHGRGLFGLFGGGNTNPVPQDKISSGSAKTKDGKSEDGSKEEKGEKSKKKDDDDEEECTCKKKKSKKNKNKQTVEQNGVINLGISGSGSENENNQESGTKNKGLHGKSGDSSGSDEDNEGSSKGKKGKKGENVQLESTDTEESKKGNKNEAGGSSISIFGNLLGGASQGKKQGKSGDGSDDDDTSKTGNQSGGSSVSLFGNLLGSATSSGSTTGKKHGKSDDHSEGDDTNQSKSGNKNQQGGGILGGLLGGASLNAIGSTGKTYSKSEDTAIKAAESEEENVKKGKKPKDWPQSSEENSKEESGGLNAVVSLGSQPFPTTPEDFLSIGLKLISGASHALLGVSVLPNFTKPDGSMFTMTPVFGGIIIHIGGGKNRNGNIRLQVEVSDLMLFTADGSLTMELDETHRAKKSTLVTVDQAKIISKFQTLMNPLNFVTMGMEFASNPKEFFKKQMSTFYPAEISLRFNVRAYLNLVDLGLKRNYLTNSRPIVLAVEIDKFPSLEFGFTLKRPVDLVDKDGKVVVRINQMSMIYYHDPEEKICQIAVHARMSQKLVTDTVSKFMPKIFK